VNDVLNLECLVIVNERRVNGSEVSVGIHVESCIEVNIITETVSSPFQALNIIWLLWL